MEKLSTPESRIDEVWILSITSRKSAAILRMSIMCSAKISPRISIPLVVNWSKRWWSSKPDKTTSSDKRSSKRSHVGRGRNRGSGASMFRRKVCVMSSVVVVFSVLCCRCCCTWLLLLPSFLVGLACSWAINACSDNRPTAISRVVRARAQVFWVRVFVLLHFLCLFVSLFLTSPLPPLPLSSPSSSSSPVFTFCQHHHQY